MTLSSLSSKTFLDQYQKETIEEWRNTARTKYEQRIEEKRIHSLENEKTFLNHLMIASEKFIAQLSERVLQQLHDCAKRGYLQKKFRYGDFREKFGPVRISTLVKGFHIQGNWDASIFEKIGLTTTPFQLAVQLLKEKGVSVEDISDITKSTGFWIQVKFSE